MMLSMILALTSKNVQEYPESGEIVGHRLALFSIMLIVFKLFMDVYVVLKFQKIQEEIDSLVHLKPVAQSRNPKAITSGKYSYISKSKKKNPLDAVISASH